VPEVSIATATRRLGNGFAEGVQGCARSAGFLSQDRAGSAVRHGGGSASARYGLSTRFRLSAGRWGHESMEDSILGRGAGVAGQPGHRHSSFTPPRADSRRKRQAQGSCDVFRPHGAVSTVRHASIMEDGQAASRVETLRRLRPAVVVPARQSASSISISQRSRRSGSNSHGGLSGSQ
jgi:hypothetical protein